VKCRKRVSDRPQNFQIAISPERLEKSRSNFNRMFDASVSILLPISVSIASKAYFGEFLTGFRHFLNAINSETAKASPLKLRLLRGSPCRYDPAKSERSEFNNKKVSFRTFDPTVSLGWGMGRPDRDRSIVLDERIIVIQFGDASCKG
jgi:hypothetical protein